MVSKKRVFISFLFILLILIFSVWATEAVEKYRKRTISRLNVSNITDTGFTVSWVSEEEEKGEVVVAKKGESFGLLPGLFKKRFYDDRDIEQNDKGEWVLKSTGSQKRHTHHVTIRGLEPDSEYEFKIMGKLFGVRLEDGIQNEIRTQKISEGLKTPDPLYGKVLDTKLEGKKDIIIYANLFEYNESKDTEINISNTISTYTNSNGGYVIDVNNFYNIDGSQYEIKDNTILKITTINHRNSYFNKFKIKNYKPLPSIIFVESAQKVARNSVYNKVYAQSQNTLDAIFQGYFGSCIVDENGDSIYDINNERELVDCLYPEDILTQSGYIEYGAENNLLKNLKLAPMLSSPLLQEDDDLLDKVSKYDLSAMTYEEEKAFISSQIKIAGEESFYKLTGMQLGEENISVGSCKIEGQWGMKCGCKDGLGTNVCHNGNIECREDIVTCSNTNNKTDDNTCSIIADDLCVHNGGQLDSNCNCVTSSTQDQTIDIENVIYKRSLVKHCYNLLGDYTSVLYDKPCPVDYQGYSLIYQLDFPKSLDVDTIDNVLQDLNTRSNAQSDFNILIYSIDNRGVVYDSIGDRKVYLASWYKPLVFTYIYENIENPKQYFDDMMDIITYSKGPSYADNRLLYLINNVCGGRDNIREYLESHNIFLDYYTKNPYPGHLNGFSLVDSRAQIEIMDLLSRKAEEHEDLKSLFSVSDATLGSTQSSANWIRSNIEGKINSKIILYKSASLLTDSSYLVIYKDTKGALWGFTFIFKAEDIFNSLSPHEVNSIIIELIEGKCIFHNRECLLDKYLKNTKIQLEEINTEMVKDSIVATPVENTLLQNSIKKFFGIYGNNIDFKDLIITLLNCSTLDSDDSVCIRLKEHNLECITYFNKMRIFCDIDKFNDEEHGIDILTKELSKMQEYHFSNGMNQSCQILVENLIADYMCNNCMGYDFSYHDIPDNGTETVFRIASDLGYDTTTFLKNLLVYDDITQEDDILCKQLDIYKDNNKLISKDGDKSLNFNDSMKDLPGMYNFDLFYEDLLTVNMKSPGYYQVLDKKFLNLNDKFLKLRFFVDLNKNGIKDSNEIFVGKTNDTHIRKIGDIDKYDLKLGWNFITLNLINNEIMTAKDLLSYFKKQNIDVIHIAKEVNGRWKIYTFREEEFSDNFNLVPGEELLVFSKNRKSFIYIGQEIR